MMGRRDLLRTGALGALMGSTGGLFAGCSSGGGTSSGGGIDLVAADTARAAGDPALIGPTALTMETFAARLYAAVSSAQPGNLVLSPYSVAVALSMTLAGARGTTARQMERLLGAAGGEGDARWHDGVNALTAYVDALAGRQKRADGSTADVGLTTANALFGQRGEAWEKAFLELLARDYGTGMRDVDFHDPERVRAQINGWVADATGDRIRDLIPSGALDPRTRLALVNAISLTAPWEAPFQRSATSDGTFHLGGGGARRVSMMTKSDLPVVRVEGSGWSGVRIPYAGRRLALTVVVPDPGRFGAVEAGLAGGGLARALGPGRSTSLTLTLPRWTSRTAVSLSDALVSLGCTTAFDPDRADFSGMTRQHPLYVGAVLHQGYIAVDEDGTEAAAATAVVMELGAAPAAPETFVVDRPFLYVVHDVDHGTPLFLGRVTDPGD